MTVHNSGSALDSGRRAASAIGVRLRRTALSVPQWSEFASVWSDAVAGLAASPMAGALVGLDGRISLVNNALCALIGFDCAHLQGMLLSDLMADPAPEMETRLAAALASSFGADQTLRHCTGADGRQLAVVQYEYEQCTDTGQPVAVVLRFLDVTDIVTSADPIDAEVVQLRLAQSISRVGSWHYVPDNRALTVSDTLLELYGLARADFHGTYDLLERCVHVDDRAKIVAATDRLGAHGDPMTLRYRVTRPTDGAERWIDSRGRVLRDESGAVVGLAGTVADVTELVLAEADLRRAHMELTQSTSYQQAVITASPDAIHVYEVATGALSRASRRETPLIGFTPAAVLVMSGQEVDTLLSAEDLSLLEEAFVEAEQLADGEVIQMRHGVRRDHAELCWLSRRMTPFQRDYAGRVTHVLVVSRDITDVVALEHRLEQAALHDDLTGLPNRRLVRDRLEHALQRAARGGHIAVLACDLDGFKRINDAHGHRTGDKVLIATAAKLVDATRAGDTVARLGGDEFTIVLDIPQHQDPYALAEQVAQRIVALVAEPVLVGDTEHTVTVSVGVSVAHDLATADDILADADTAMYYGKSHGGNGLTVFHLSQRPDTAHRDNVERQIRRALADETLEVHYQPIVNPYTDALYGVEALLRIPSADGGFLNTAEAIQICEQTGLVSEIDQRVLQLACRQAVAWRSCPEHHDLILKINRSVKDITKPGFYDRIQETLQAVGLPPGALTLEITETVLLDADKAGLADLWRLNEDGVGLAIDDFGTGYASMRYLAELPITCIKIDRSFTLGLPHDHKAMTLVRTTVGLAEQLDITCVVEGVETIEQLGALPHYGRLLIQGYLYGRPQPASEMLPSRLVPLPT